MKPRRPSIPLAVQTALLVANRHACCVCQKPRVQIHHIDGDRANNDPVNLATLCTDHHDLASMQIGLTKKLKPAEVAHYKETWEARCKEDALALSRDRENFYVTLYKNPPRIRQLFSSLSSSERREAARRLARSILEEDVEKSSDAGFGFQVLPRRNEITLECLASAVKGELWPSWIPRVGGHPNDPDYPIELGPPNGMNAFHWFDLYCHILVRLLAAARTATPLEALYGFRKLEELDAFSGSLVNFRERSYGKGVRTPRAWNETPTGSIQFRRKVGQTLFRANMNINTMYVFSDTAAENLKKSRVCGVGIFGGAESVGKQEIVLRVVPLLVGLGGFGQSDPSGWMWNLK
jgi:hypothetical protein